MPINKLHTEKGAVFLEYVIALGGLIAVFVIVGAILQIAAVKVSKRSVESVRQDTPCSREDEDILTPEQCL